MTIGISIACGATALRLLRSAACCAAASLSHTCMISSAHARVWSFGDQAVQSSRQSQAGARLVVERW
eukprot:SAG22_NODE_136_length_18095_cov_19.897255_17_plen_67_part_00